MAKKYRDFSLNFYPNPATGDVSIVSDESAISQAIKNLIMTDTDEIPFMSKFGGNIRAKLFELVTPFALSTTKTEIITAIENYEPRAEIGDVSVKQGTDKNGIYVAIVYRARTSTQDITLNYFLERII